VASPWTCPWQQPSLLEGQMRKRFFPSMCPILAMSFDPQTTAFVLLYINYSEAQSRQGSFLKSLEGLSFPLFRPSFSFINKADRVHRCFPIPPPPIFSQETIDPANVALDFHVSQTSTRTAYVRPSRVNQTSFLHPGPSPLKFAAVKPAVCLLD